jgi:hypothetical protein
MFAPYGAWIERLPAGRFPECAALNALLDRPITSGGGAAIRFVDSAPAGEPYEQHVFHTGEVMTRPDNWHDLFNALAWMAFPLTKRIINARHCEEIGRRGVSGVRGTVRDVLTIFDEGGVIAAASDPALLGLVHGFHWKELFWHKRSDAMERMRFVVFGHALLEKALEPYKGATAKAMLVEVAPGFMALAPADQLAHLDERAAAWFSRPESTLSTRTLSPLPILGVPGWAANDTAAFYDDPEVFRPGYGKAGTVGSSP